MKLIYDFCRNCGRFYNGRRISGVLCSGFRLTVNPNLDKIQNKIPCGFRFASIASDNLSPKVVKKFLEHATKVFEGKENDKFDIVGVLEIQEVGNLVQERVKILENIQALEDLSKSDKEMKLLAEEEFALNSESLKNIDERLLDLISINLGRDYCDSVILEISAGVGGQEAMLFANDLLQMYTSYINYLGYSCALIERESTDLGGIRRASLTISGKGSYERLRHEAGIHRVQRIPSTETSGRIHTSVVSVVIFPQPSDIEVSLSDKDLRIETFRSSGAGGQSVNKTDSAVRIVHVPTGTVVESQSERSQIRNKSIALIRLRTKIFESRLNAQVANTRAIKRKQMGFKGRNERIRTYNFLQDRVTDHRIQNGTMHGLGGFMKGGAGLTELQDRLQKDFERKILVETINDVDRK